MIRKLILYDGRAEREVMMVGTIVVGRDPSCQITDIDPLLSRRHAEFVPGAKNVVLRDLGSRNGILVNGEKVSEYMLNSGDVVQLGHLQLRYIEEHVVQTPEAAAKSHATTAGNSEAPTMAPRTFRPSAAIDLDDTGVPTSPIKPLPVPPHPSAPRPAAVAEAPPVDMDATFAPGIVPTDPDATGAGSVVPGQAVDMDATFAPGLSTPAATVDLDATFAPGVPGGRAGVPTSMPLDPDATFAPGVPIALPADPDATFAPAMQGGAPPVHAGAPATHTGAPSDFDATFAVGMRATGGEATVVAGANLVVTLASPECRALLGAHGGPIVGEPLADVVMRAVRAVASGSGPATLSCAVSRRASDRGITVTFKAGQAVETVS